MMRARAKRERDAGSVDGDPAAAPLFGDVGGGAGAAGRIEDEITGIGGHEDAALDELRTVWTTYIFSSVKLPVPVSFQMLPMA